MLLRMGAAAKDGHDAAVERHGGQRATRTKGAQQLVDVDRPLMFSLAQMDTVAVRMSASTVVQETIDALAARKAVSDERTCASFVER